MSRATSLWGGTLARYVLREFIKVFALALLACTLFMLLVMILIKAHEYEELGISTGQIALLFPYLLPWPLSYSVPLATLIATVLVFGRMSADNEILAAQAGGAPLRVMAWPLLACGVLLSGFGLWCNQSGLAWGWFTVKNEILQIDKVEFYKTLEKPGSTLNYPTADGGVARINLLPYTRDENGKVCRPIYVAHFSNQQVGQTILAQDYDSHYTGTSVADRTLELTLYNGQVFGDKTTFFEKSKQEIHLPDLSTVVSMGDSPGEKGWWQNHLDAVKILESEQARRRFLLQRAADFGAQAVAGSPADPAAAGLGAAAWQDTRVASESIYGSEGALDQARASEVECWRKLALSLLPLPLVLLGIGLGLLVRKSQLMVGFLLGIAVFGLCYYPLTIFFKELASAGKIGPWAVWIPHMLFALVGYTLWRWYEYGALGGYTGGGVVLAALTPTGDPLSWLDALWRKLAPFLGPFSKVSRRRTDAYISGSFIVPLLVVVLALAGVFVGVDMAQRGKEVTEGIAKAAEPLPGAPARTEAAAVRDVAEYYAIRTLEVTCDLLPVFLLLAGVLSVTILVRNNEHLIFKSAGVRLQRAFRPMLVWAFVLSVAAALLGDAVIPSLIMIRDYLKPLVYHRAPAPTALALHTTDAEGRPVLFQMSQYQSGTRTGKDLRVYLLSEAQAGRMPAIVADTAAWNDARQGWTLGTVRKVPGADKNAAPVATLDYGFKVTPQLDATRPEAENPDTDEPSSFRPIVNVKAPLSVWYGGVTPSLLESDRLGPRVMNVRNLIVASGVKREFAVELWRRLPACLMGVILLWLTLPLLLREEGRGPLWGIAFSILIGAGYWGLNMACVEAARRAYLPVWTPLLPHLVFLGLGGWGYYWKMET